MFTTKQIEAKNKTINAIVSIHTNDTEVEIPGIVNGKKVDYLSANIIKNNSNIKTLILNFKDNIVVSKTLINNCTIIFNYKIKNKNIKLKLCKKKIFLDMEEKPVYRLEYLYNDNEWYFIEQRPFRPSYETMKDWIKTFFS